MNKSTLSVLMPNYNHSKYIGDALEAILSQSYKPSEIIVIDDASTDNSVEIIQRFVELNPEVRLIKNEKNMGVIYNMNKLLELAKGEYVHFAAADDRILPDFYMRSMDLLVRYPQAGLCSALILIIDEYGMNKGLHPSFIISKEEGFVTPEKSRSILERAGNWVMGNSTILKRKALIDSGGFRPELGAFTDGFIYQVISLKYGTCFIPEPLACWRKMESGYASLSGINPDIMRKVVSHATHLMRTTYRDLFEREYIDDFEKVEFFHLNLKRLTLKHRKELILLSDRLEFKAFKTFFYFVFRLRQEFEKIYYRLYLLFSLRPRIRPLVNIKFNKWLHPYTYYASRKMKI